MSKSCDIFNHKITYNPRSYTYSVMDVVVGISLTALIENNKLSCEIDFLYDENDKNLVEKFKKNMLQNNPCALATGLDDYILIYNSQKELVYHIWDKRCQIDKIIKSTEQIYFDIDNQIEYEGCDIIPKYIMIEILDKIISKFD